MIKITIRLPENVHREIIETAKREDRSMNQQIIRVLREYLYVIKQEQKKDAETKTSRN